MKKVIIVLLLTVAGLYSYASINLTQKRDLVYIENNTSDSDWEPYEGNITAYAYYGSGRRHTEYNMDLIHLTIWRRIVNGKVQYRTKVDKDYYLIRQSNLKGYSYCFTYGNLIYHFNM